MKSALVLIDLIEDYFDPEIWPQSRLPGRRRQMVERTNELVGTCRTARVPIVWVRQEFAADGSNVFPHMRRRGMTYAIEGSPGSRLLPELAVDADDTVTTKHRFSAFFETDLQDILRYAGADSLILAGITTGWCVRATATDAYQLGYDIILASESLDSFTEEDHERSLAAMDGYIARAFSNQELIDIL